MFGAEGFGSHLDSMSRCAHTGAKQAAAPICRGYPAENMENIRDLSLFTAWEWGCLFVWGAKVWKSLSGSMSRCAHTDVKHAAAPICRG